MVAPMYDIYAWLHEGVPIQLSHSILKNYSGEGVWAIWQ